MACVATASGASLATRVTYLSADLIYVDAGRAQGVAAGQSGDVWRDGAVIAALEIIAVTERTASGKLSALTLTPVAGDYVTITVADSVESAPPADLTVRAEPSTAPLTAKPSRPMKARHSRVTGRVAMQAYLQDDRLSSDTDILQPAVLTRLKVNALFGTRMGFSFRMRNRRTYTTQAGESAGTAEWDHRFYEAQLALDDPASPLKFQGGRILVGNVGGIGYLDGAYLQYRLLNSWSVATFAGTQPDLKTTAFQSSVRKTGAGLIWSPRQEDQTYWSMTTALAGEYNGSDISREFIYHQFSVTLGNKFSLYENADLNLNRGWKADTEGSTVRLAQATLNARYQISKPIAISVGYDSHANYRTWETRETPDSLFDEAMHLGYRSGLELALPYGIRCDVRETVRNDASTSKFYASTSAGAMTHRLVNGRIGLSARYDAFENQFTSGLQQTGGAAWTTPLRGDFTVQVGQTAYRTRDTGLESSSTWWRATFDFALGRHMYGASALENHTGNNEDNRRVTLELGYRL